MAVKKAPLAAPPAPVAQSAVKVDLIIEKYIALRDKKEELAKLTKEKIAAFDVVLERIEVVLLGVMNKTGTTQLKTKGIGTAFQSTKVGIKVRDWDETFSFIRENEQWDMLEHRVSKTAIEAWRTEHNDLPPGIDRFEEITVNVRRD